MLSAIDAAQTGFEESSVVISIHSIIANLITGIGGIDSIIAASASIISIISVVDKHVLAFLVLKLSGELTRHCYQWNGI